MISIIHAEDLSFGNEQLAAIMHRPHGTNNSFYSQARHAGYLLASELELITVFANILFMFFKVCKQCRDTNMWVLAGDCL